jgi:hypothetical protein
MLASLSIIKDFPSPISKTHNPYGHTTMSENISNNAIIYAILALDSETSLQKEYLESDDVPEEEREDEEGILDDLEQAFMEFVDIYKKRCKADKKLPSLEELLNSEI